MLPGEISAVELSAVLNQLQLASRACCSATLTTERSNRQPDGYGKTGRVTDACVDTKLRETETAKHVLASEVKEYKGAKE